MAGGGFVNSLRCFRLTVLFLAIVLGAGGASCPPAPPSELNALSVEQLITEVHTALENTAETLVARKVHLTSAILDLQVVASRKNGASIQLWVLSVDRSTESEATQQVILTLVPEADKEIASIHSGEFATLLENAIVAAAKAVEADVLAQKNKTPKAKVPLKLHTLEATVSFVVTASGGGGAKATMAPIPVTVGLEGSSKSKAVQKLTLKFEEK
jgi:hypothetical protein